MLTLEAQRRKMNHLLLLLPLGGRGGGEAKGFSSVGKEKGEEGTRRGGGEEGSRTRWGTRGGLQVAETLGRVPLIGHSKEVIIENPLAA